MWFVLLGHHAVSVDLIPYLTSCLVYIMFSHMILLLIKILLSQLNN